MKGLLVLMAVLCGKWVSKPRSGQRVAISAPVLAVGDARKRNDAQRRVTGRGGVYGGRKMRIVDMEAAQSTPEATVYLTKTTSQLRFCLSHDAWPKT